MLKFRSYLTLIEMIIIVAILMTLLVPSLDKTLSFSKKLQCGNIQRAYSGVLSIYAEDSDEWFVPLKLDTGWGTSWNYNQLFRDLLGVTHNDYTRFIDSVTCPDVDPKAAGSNMRPKFFGFNRTGHRFGRTVGLMFHSNKVASPGKKIQMIEGTDWHLDSGQANYQARWDVYGQFRLWQVAYRHDEGAQMLFFDGHVEHRYKADVYFDGDTDSRDDLWRINSEASK